MLTQRTPTSSTGPRGQVDDKIWVPELAVPPTCVVRRSPPSLILARDAVEEQARVRKRTRPVDKAIGRSRVLGVSPELALLRPIQNALGWHVLGFLCHGCRWKRRVDPIEWFESIVFIRHLGSLTAANWVSFDFNDSYSSC